MTTLDRRSERLLATLLLTFTIATSIFVPENPFAIMTVFFIGAIPLFVNSPSGKLRTKIDVFFDDKMDKAILIAFGILIISSGVALNNIIPLVDQITIYQIGSCVSNIHFNNHTEKQFTECLSADFQRIQAIQIINAIVIILVSIGGVFVGHGIIKKESHNDV